MPPLVNDAKLARFADGVLRLALGEECVTDRYDAGLGCEEFSLFLQHVPGLFLYIGNDLPGKPVVPIHAPNYVFNPKILPNGVKALCELALTFCGAGYPLQP